MLRFLPSGLKIEIVALTGEEAAEINGTLRLDA